MTEPSYTESHEWVRLDGEIATVGISTFAQKQLGDIVYVELPPTGTTVAKGKSVAVVESVKAASEIYAPVSGLVVETNAAIVDNPALINDDPLAMGWFFKIEVSNPVELAGLLDEAAYSALVGGAH
jgi:glycine cleavage system H protein